jgi:hypothetical protein
MLTYFLTGTCAIQLLHLEINYFLRSTAVSLHVLKFSFVYFRIVGHL